MELRVWQFWILNCIAVLVLVMVVVNISLFRSNRAIQAEITTRQQFINQTVPLSRLNSKVIQSLANLSAQTADTAIRDLLADHGITFTVDAAKAQPATR